MPRLLSLVALAAVAAAPAAAQTVTARVKPDWWGEVAVQGGSFALSCDVCSGRVWGLGPTGAVGVRFKKHVELGLGLTTFFGSRDGTSQRVVTLGPVARVYTSPARTTYVRGGLGYQHYRAAEGTSRLTSGTVVVSVGVGRRFSFAGGDLTPFADLTVTPSAGLNQGDREIARGGSNAFLAGLSYRFD